MECGLHRSAGAGQWAAVPGDAVEVTPKGPSRRPCYAITGQISLYNAGEIRGVYCEI